MRAFEEASPLAQALHLEAIRAHGLRLIQEDGSELRSRSVRAVQRMAEAGPQDAVLLTVKAHQVGALLPELRDLFGPRTTLVTMINGIPWWYFHKLAGPHQGRDHDGRGAGGGRGGGRAVQRPVRVVTGSRFAAPQRFVIAFDGSPTARRTVERVAASPLLAGLPVRVAMAGADGGPARRQLDEARSTLEQAGFRVETEAVLPPLLRAQGASLLVTGAYGHSRIRQLVVGSTTTTLLRTADVPALVLR